mgnify:CR=1 FL=1
MMSEKLLDIKNLAVHYASGKDTVKAVNGISFGLEKGESLGLVGETGAGKTTTALAIMGLVPNPPGKVVNGEILFEGEDLLQTSQADMRKIRGAKISMIFQDPMTALNPVLTVGEQICEVIHLHQNIPRTEATQRAVQMMELVGIEGSRYNDYPHQFSGGMKQRLGIAQALLNDPRILILDEPTAGLDPKERVRFRNLISSLAENRIVILSTHIVSDVEYIANEILIMKNGELIQHGSPEEILKPIEKCVWECDVSRKEAEELELNYVTANLKHNNGAERLRIISQEAPCRTAWNVDPTLEDLYLYYFAEVSEHE